MIRFKIKDSLYEVVDGFNINESSREVKFSNLKIDFTDKTMADLPLKYQECQLVEGEWRTVPASDGKTVEGTSLYLTDVNLDYNYDYLLKGNTTQSGTPTPSTPIPVNTVTGRQEITINENSYEINLGKNLFDKNNYNSINAYINASGKLISNASNTSIYISCEPNTTYTISRTQPTTGNNRFGICYTNVLPASNVQSGGFLRNNTADSLTITTNSNAQYLVVWCYVSDYDDTLENTLASIQIEKGSQATSYAEYFTPIELCKIGDYQDRIYKENDKWYLYKTIAKFIPTGNETWIYDTSKNFCRMGGGVFESQAIQNQNQMNTHFQYRASSWANFRDATTTDCTYIIQTTASSGYQLCLRNTSLTSKNEYVAWIKENQPVFYYQMATPTTEEITDTELINQLNAVELLDGINNISINNPYLPAIMRLHYNYHEEYDIDRIDDIIYTGYINNFILPNMKNKKEYRELEIDLLSPLSIATLRTVDAVGTYNLQPLVKELIQPLIDDGFTLKEFNIGNNQITVNYLMETVESALNKLSNKFSFWWHIDVNKNIYINSISYLMSLKSKLVYNDDNKIKGLIDVIPSIDATDYCNTIDFTNVRVYSDSFYSRRYIYSEEKQTYELKKEYYNPLIDKDYIKTGDEIEFKHPVVVNKKIKHTAGGYLTHVQDQFLSFSKINSDRTYSNLFTLDLDDNGEMVLPSNVSIEDSYTNTNEFVLVKDPFFSNLITGMKYNGSSDIEVGIFLSSTALIWSKIRILDEVEINKNKNIISRTGIVEKQIDT